MKAQVKFKEAHKAIGELCLAVQSSNGKQTAIFDSLEVLYEMLRYNKGAEVTRYRIITGIVEANFRTKAALRFLAKVLRKDESPLVRHEAAFALGMLNDGEYIGPLKDVLLIDKSPIVLHEVAIALATVGNESCLELLEAAARYRNNLVASSAKYALRLIRLRLNL